MTEKETEFLNKFKNLNLDLRLCYTMDNQLIDACKEGDLEKFKYVIENEGLINIYKNNNFLLRLASAFGHLKIVKYLIEKGADINAEEALLDACRNNNFEVVDFFLLNNYINKNAYDNALSITFYTENKEMFSFLSKRGNYNGFDKDIKHSLLNI